MNHRPWNLASVVVVIWCGTAAAYVFQNPLTPSPDRQTRCLIRGTSPSKTRARIRVAAPIAGDRVTSESSKLLIFNSVPGGTTCVSYTLPPWTEKHGNFYYRDRQLAISPVWRASLIADRPRFNLRSSTSQPLNYALNAAHQGGVAVIFITPYGPTCSAFGPPCSTDADCGGAPGSCQDSRVENCVNFVSPIKDEPGTFLSRTAAPITSCPTPPPGCSPSGAFLDPVGD